MQRQARWLVVVLVVLVVTVLIYKMIQQLMLDAKNAQG
jgi:hypothetical protein